MMRIERVWAMPNKRTFMIEPIRQMLFEEEVRGRTIDPFPFTYKKDALEFLGEIKDSSVDMVLFDPPYSLRQLKECYQSIGRAITGEESRLVYTQWKDEIARVIRPGGKCISFAWNSGGLGMSRGFEIERILLVAHGGNHNDTICTVERKVQHILKEKMK